MILSEGYLSGPLSDLLHARIVDEVAGNTIPWGAPTRRIIGSPNQMGVTRDVSRKDLHEKLHWERMPADYLYQGRRLPSTH